MLGATKTANEPEVAVEGIVTVMELSFQELMVRAAPFNITKLLPWAVPKPIPEITT
jgi:hypothetical protein